MVDKIKRLQERLEEIKTRISKLNSLQYELERKIQKFKEDNCKKHDFQFDCHGHNDDAYRCSKCGKMEWR